MLMQLGELDDLAGLGPGDGPPRVQGDLQDHELDRQPGQAGGRGFDSTCPQDPASLRGICEIAGSPIASIAMRNPTSCRPPEE